MRVVVGLGNPEETHRNNRHNVGFVVVDRLAEKIDNSDWQEVRKFNSLIIKTSDFVLAKPSTFMNNSGLAVKRIVGQYKAKPLDLWVVHDDLDLKLGEYKIQKGKGPKLHGGVNSIETSLRTDDFWRVRIGVDNRSADNGIDGERYVLQDFSGDELEILKETVNNVVSYLLVRLT
jgi:PTH1 family peptidyl-tRNA hydrolase